MNRKLLGLVITISAAAGALLTAVISSAATPSAVPAAAPVAANAASGAPATPATTPTDAPSLDPTMIATPDQLPTDTTGHAGQISSDFVVSTIEAQLSQQTAGSTVTVTCPRTGLFTSVAGDTFDCSFTSVSATGTERDGQVEVDVTSSSNNWTWKVV